MGNNFASGRQKWTRDIVEMLLGLMGDPTFPGVDGYIALHRAAGNGHVEVVNTVIKAHGYMELEGKDGWTALTLTPVAGQVFVAKALLDARAASARFGSTPLHLIASRGQTKVGVSRRCWRTGEVW